MELLILPKVDGTRAIPSSIYSSCDFNGRCLPMIYRVLPRKDTAIYVRILTET